MATTIQRAGGLLKITVDGTLQEPINLLDINPLIDGDNVVFSNGTTVSFTSGNNKVIGLYINKNGTIVSSSEMYATTSGSGRAESIHVQTVLELTANDYIELWIENDTDTTDITVEFLNFIAKSL